MPSATVPIVSPTSVPAAPASLASSTASATTTPTPSTPVVASFPIVPALPSTIIASIPTTVTPSAPVIAVSPAKIVTTLYPMPIYASVVPAATTPIVSPAPSAATATTVTPTPSATATAAPPISITNPMPVQIAPAHISDASPATQKDCVEKVEVLHVKATGVEELASIAVTYTADQSTQSASASTHEPYLLLLCKIDIKI